MTSTNRVAALLRGALVAGLIGAATVGMAGTAEAAVLTAAPAVSSAQHRIQAVDYDDGDGGGADFAEQPAYEAPEAPAYEAPEAPAEEAPEAPAYEAPEAPAEEYAPEEAPAEAPPADEAPAQDPQPVDEAPAQDAQPVDEAPAQDAQPVDEAPAQEPQPVAPDASADEPAPAPPGPPAAAEPADAPEVPDVSVPADEPGEAAVTEAGQSDVTTAESATVVDANASTVSTSTVDEVRSEILSEMNSTTSVTGTWDREITQWNSSWISYDAYYRPVLLNPYRTPLQLFYTYGNAPRTVTVAPLSRVVLDVPNAGVYNFTGLRRTPSGALNAVSVGSFTGGGFVPAPGRPRPVKPVVPPASKNVLVRLQYANGSSLPFRVKQLADLGDDNVVHARRVLIDDTTSAWGQWTKTATGEREFDITKTLQLPGLAGPAQSPLPGYQVVPQKH
ncbi:hypothetical protein JRC04_01510 [Mycolicibacterium sp. S2-37]|uniref:hypothetical protein n=1 Tax=Mycolicibacterium sp. S2-37 TaxID=2810297 RepID=UPI001A9477A3|nr:hypothetical protein [Mycolicibacterium sp. S2-37]MBO0676133.1 hypothetical protein [Mycolicibacterium sp. S2-37]